MRKDLFSRQKQFCRTRGWQYCLTALFLLLSVGIYAQATATQTFTGQGYDVDNPQIVITPDLITVNGGEPIQSISIFGFATHYNTSGGTDWCGNYYAFDFYVSGTPSDYWPIFEGCASDVVNHDVTGFTNITATAVDIDNYPAGDYVYFELTLKVTYEGEDQCAINTFPFTETFEDGSTTRGCWANEYETGSINWAYRAGTGSGSVVTTAHGGAKNASFFYGSYSAAITKLVSPKFDFTNVTDPTVTFWYANPSWSGDQNKLRVYYKTAEAGPWTMIDGAEYATDVTAWTEVTLDLPDGDNQSEYYIAFEGENHYGYGVVVDDMTVDGVVTTGGGGCEWTVHVWDDDYYGDEVEWELRDSGGTALISGGGYGLGYDDTQTVTADGPLTFWITNDGSFGDNEPAYEISNENGVIFSGALSGPTTTESSALNCDDEPIPTCSGTPDGGTASADPTSGLNGAVSHFTVTGYSAGSLGLTYDWEYSVNGGAWLSTGAAADDVNFTITGNHGDEFAVRYVVTCTNSGETAYSNEVIYTVDNTNCTPAFSDTTDYIVNFQLEDIQNIGSGFSAGGYGDFTAMSTDLEADQTYTASLTSSSGSGTHAAGVWIDFNDNDAFELSERVGYTDGIGANQTKDITLTIPAGVSGEHKMRVLYQWNVTGVNLIPCVSYTYGEAEDYTVNFGSTAPDGCLDAPYGQYPSATFIPSCSGVPEVINTICWTGEYSKVQVTAGTEYHFSSSIATDFVTIGNEDGTVVLAAGPTPLTWTADASQVVRFYLHLADDCSSINSGFRSRIVQCGDIQPPPANDDCDNAIAVSCGDTVSGSTASATDSGGNVAGDVFYTFTGNGTPQMVTASLCGSSYDTYIRVYSDCSLTNQIAFNDDSCGVQSSVTFDSDGTSTYVIMVEGYSSNTGAFEMNVTCEDAHVIEPPDFPCYQGDGLASNGPENGYGVDPTDIYRVADDFFVDAGTEFVLQQVSLNVLSSSAISNATINIHEDDGGAPSATLAGSVTMAPSDSFIFGAAFGFDAYHLTFDLATPITLSEGTYWLEPTISNTGNTTVYWEMTSIGSHGAVVELSNTSGTSWVPDDSGSNYQAVFFVAGECNTVEEPGNGCFTTGTFDQWPSTTFIPSCSGAPEVISTACWAGEFSKVQVTAGTEYVFSSSVTTDFITIADEDEEITFATGTGSVTWTSPIDQVIRFYTHADEDCTIEETSRSRIVQCGNILPPPANDDCANAIALSCGDSDSGNTAFATDSGGNAAGDVFYSFTGDGTPQLVTVSLCGSAYDTYLRVYSDCTLNEQITFNDDSCGLQSQLQFVSDGTSTYIIMVEGFSSNVGAYTINVSCAEVPPSGEGCLNATYGQYPSTTYVPGCVGAPETITAAAYAGEYSMVQVTAGTEYIFSSSIATDFITIGNEMGDTVLAYGEGSLTWTSDADQLVRFYTHVNDACLESTDFRARMVQCGDEPVEPDYGCDQTYDAGQFSLASSVSADLGYMVTNDFFVPMEAEQYKINSVTLLLLPFAGSDNDFLTFDLYILNDNGGVPGDVLQPFLGLTAQNIDLYPELFAGYNTYMVTLDLGGYVLPVDSGADTRYWLAVSAYSATGTNIFWVGYPYTEGWNTHSSYQSSDGGGVWEQVTYDGIGDHYDGYWSIEADCELGVSDMNSFNFTYYPNPVKDYLTIDAKKAIETISVHNLAGQSVLQGVKAVDGKVNMSSLSPGVYVFRVTLEGGQVETFKVIKK